MSATTHGFSDAARFIERTTREERRHIGRSITFGLQDAVRELATVYEDCCNANWDGFGGEPVTQDVLRQALCVLESLPLGMAMPSIGADPDGQITLEWYRSPSQTISVSVDANGDLHYASLSGANRTFGDEVFVGDLPAVIRGLIHRVLGE